MILLWAQGQMSQWGCGKLFSGARENLHAQIGTVWVGHF
jgi:hypothetical protein